MLARPVPFFVNKNQERGSWELGTVGRVLAVQAGGSEFNPWHPHKKADGAMCDPSTREMGGESPEGSLASQ